jgi:hypothetical protein
MMRTGGGIGGEKGSVQWKRNRTPVAKVLYKGVLTAGRKFTPNTRQKISMPRPVPYARDVVATKIRLMIPCPLPISGTF